MHALALTAQFGRPNRVIYVIHQSLMLHTIYFLKFFLYYLALTTKIIPLELLIMLLLLEINIII